ncbi:uncharacterized protein K460DRAFT_170851 [Cucurbitaria berberidis CBS 394.84]|uniref:Secreted protein n=1 Tax=Cucurbitaria berberidis CBS 394.84 TaxID=1168544 RepID=A0A9P4G9I9_9PLEO|nr:uncharacterized protein K460DRAFT_170851 [Cucurbitaria berberidis CBS 394.84]KAF1841648.1 hypothetical protein K460DRAFT_170851 [Cucurbitaria berberidis CBS 394.84]
MRGGLATCHAKVAGAHLGSLWFLRLVTQTEPLACLSSSLTVAEHSSNAVGNFSPAIWPLHTANEESYSCVLICFRRPTCFGRFPPGWHELLTSGTVQVRPKRMLWLNQWGWGILRPPDLHFNCREREGWNNPSTSPHLKHLLSCQVQSSIPAKIPLVSWGLASC